MTGFRVTTGPPAPRPAPAPRGRTRTSLTRKAPSAGSRPGPGRGKATVGLGSPPGRIRTDSVSMTRVDRPGRRGSAGETVTPRLRSSLRFIDIKSLVTILSAFSCLAAGSLTCVGPRCRVAGPAGCRVHDAQSGRARAPPGPRLAWAGTGPSQAAGLRPESPGPGR